MALLSVVGRGGASRTVLAAAALGAVMLAALTALAFAQADGPDYFRIDGLKKEDRVNVRRGPNADAKIVGKIPKDTDGLKNLGCKGGLTQKQWAKASEAKKKLAAKERWCQVEHDGVKGWVSGRFLGEGTAPQAAAKPEEQASPQAQTPAAPTAIPSFDCAKAEKNWEKLTCADNELAAVDREAARLYQLASDAMNATPGFEQLLDSQSKWRGQLATCFDRECVSEMLVRRVHQLRRDFRDTRAQDTNGISMGPLLARCEGFPQPIAVTFVNSDPGLVYLEWMGGAVAMPHVPSGSGALYEGSFARLHVKADEALLLVPGGKGEMNCKLEPGG